MRWIAEGCPLIIFGDGSQQRDFVYVDDVANASLLALKHFRDEVTNIGNDRPASIRQVIALLEKRLGCVAGVEHRPAHPADVPATWVGIGKARRLFGWEPQMSLEEGIHATVGWYEQNRSWGSQIGLED